MIEEPTDIPITTMNLNYEVPDGCHLLSIGPRRDGQWRVCIALDHRFGPQTCATGIATTPLEASRSIRAELAEYMARAQAILAERRAIFERSPSARAAPPDIRGRPTAPNRPTGSPGSVVPSQKPSTRPANAVTGWTDSVPRQAAEWHVATDKTVEVILWPGLEFPPDAPGSKVESHSTATHRRFSTVRQAKDWTRSAISTPQPTMQNHMQSEGDIEEAAFQRDLFNTQ